jgi:hypothetical protein
MAERKYFKSHFEIFKILINFDRNDNIGYKFVIILNILQGFFDIIYISIAIPVIYRLSGAAANISFIEYFNEVEVDRLYFIFTASSLIYLILKTLDKSENFAGRAPKWRR